MNKNIRAILIVFTLVAIPFALSLATHGVRLLENKAADHVKRRNEITIRNLTAELEEIYARQQASSTKLIKLFDKNWTVEFTQAVLNSGDPIKNNYVFFSLMPKSSFRKHCTDDCNARFAQIRSDIRNLPKSRFFDSSKRERDEVEFEYFYRWLKDNNEAMRSFHILSNILYHRIPHVGNKKDYFISLKKLERSAFRGFSNTKFSGGRIDRFLSESTCLVVDGRHSIVLSKCSPSSFELDKIILFLITSVSQIDGINGLGLTVSKPLVQSRGIFSCKKEWRCRIALDIIHK